MVSEGEGKIYSGCVVFIHLMFEYLICVVACILTLKSLQSSEGGSVGKWHHVGNLLVDLGELEHCELAVSNGDSIWVPSVWWLEKLPSSSVWRWDVSTSVHLLHISLLWCIFLNKTLISWNTNFSNSHGLQF